MLRISDAEKEFTRQGARLGCRVDGRANLEYRHVTIDCGVIEQATGSARVCVHGGATDVVCAVKVELTEPRERAPDRGIVEADVDTFIPIAASSQRRAVKDANEELTTNLNALLAAPGALDLHALAIIPGQLVWKVYVDIVILEAGGSLMDACALAAVSALANTELPKLKLVRGGEDGTRLDVDLEGAGEPGTGVPFPSVHLPVHVTFASIAGQTVVDTSVEEESVAESRVRVAINRTGAVCLVATEAGTAGGDGGLQPQTLHTAVEAAKGIAGQLFAQVDAAVAEASLEGDGAAAGGGGVSASALAGAGAGAGAAAAGGKAGGSAAVAGAAGRRIDRSALRGSGPGSFLSRSRQRQQEVLVADASLRVDLPA